MRKSHELNAANRDPLEVLFDLGGFYERPTDPGTGRKEGPIVGYAGKYNQVPDDPTTPELQWVGEKYANFAEAEQWPDIYDAWSDRFEDALRLMNADTYMGLPMAGIPVAISVARTMGKRFIYPDRKVTKLATASSREESELKFGRHGIRQSGEQVALCEDVTNNFSTTAEAVKLVEGAGGEVVAIVTILNRSFPQVTSFQYQDRQIPVIALVEKPIEQYRQDDPAMAEAIANGDVVWKVKPEWPRLAEAMRRFPK